MARTEEIHPDRIIPKDGGNPYANHPGFEQNECPIRYTVTPRSAYGVQTGGGFGCEVTGGHCLPGEHCGKRRADAKAQDELKAMLDEVRHLPKVIPNE
jgi:hypothetical protein